MKRFQDWPIRLEKAVIDHAQLKFKYGQHDCCLSVCDCVLAMTGEDLAEDFRGYKTKKQAFDLLKKRAGIKGIIEEMAKKHNIEEIQTSFGQRGDVVLINYNNRDSLGIIDLSGRFVLVASIVGWCALPVKEAIRAWRIE